MDYEKQRKRMVEEQLRLRGISDPRVLKAFMEVKRHRFVPTPFDVASYADRPLPIGHGQTISQPYMVAVMTESLRLGGGDKVLEIGTGSGYQAAILAEICGRVYTIEREERLLEHAKKVLREEEYANIEFACGDGTKGWEEKAPFDGIIVTAGAPHVPESLKDQLSERGRLVIPVGSMWGQMLMAIERKGDKFVREDICGCVFVPLVGKDGWSDR
ncbi:MAG: protein-L-isoaspartate(D-aspartate) O-methyltransferase [Candidatus Omnitrophota bacterium]|nr:protein-L-isoaspartate(D-aspartate) O-methyltransferase [Candidatus Omnitrophota bacterium]